VIARALILIARGWQLGPSRILPPSCRYNPSCSAYAIMALSRYGPCAGAGWLSNVFFVATPGGDRGTIRFREESLPLRGFW